MKGFKRTGSLTYIHYSVIAATMVRRAMKKEYQKIPVWLTKKDGGHFTIRWFDTKRDRPGKYFDDTVEDVAVKWHRICFGKDFKPKK